MDATSKSDTFRASSGSGAFAKPLPLTHSAIIVGRNPGRARDNEIIVFDSSGAALQDVAATAAVFRRAAGQQQGVHFPFNA